jgi:predicted dinucleotide-binding enzyme
MEIERITNKGEIMVRTIGIIGSGPIGSTIARFAVAAGFNVVISNSRGKESLSKLIAELGPLARAGSPDEAANAGEIIIAAIPFFVFEKLPADSLAGKIVVDTMNYYPIRDGQIPDIDSGKFTTSELVQQHLKNSKVVKALHNQDSPHLNINASPGDRTKRTTLPIAGDDEEAKTKVAEFLDAIGYNSIDTGSLAESWRIEPGLPIYLSPYGPKVPDGLTREEVKKFYMNTPGKPLSEIEAKHLVAKAERKFPVGGFINDLPPGWLEIVEDFINANNKQGNKK